MDPNEIESLRLEHSIDVDRDLAAPAPVRTLDLVQFPDETLKALKDDANIERPTPIQMQARSDQE